MFLQERFIPKLTIEEATQNVRIVLRKREVQNAVMTGIALDKAAEANSLEEPLQKIIAEDEGLYGVDEVLAFSIVNVMDQLVLLITAILIGLSQEFWPSSMPTSRGSSTLFLMISSGQWLPLLPVALPTPIRKSKTIFIDVFLKFSHVS